MRHRGFVALLVALALLGAACGSSDGSPKAKAAQPKLEYTGSTAGFYVPPPLRPNGSHGDLLRYQRLPDLDGSRTYRILYRSTSVAGKAIAVSGLAAIPSGGGSGRPVLTWAHGTTGIADQCAPSRQPIGAEGAFLGQFLRQGWVVAATDYEGLGTPGRHPYLAGISEGRGTLDAARAVKQLPTARAGRTTVIWGHSQGGQAALFAGQLAATWTPDLHVVGTVAGAPPSELPLIASALKGGHFQGYLALVAAGLNAAYPQAKLAQILTPKALAALHVVDEGCTAEVFAAFNPIPYDQFALADPTSVESWKAVLAENDPGHVKTASPILVIHGLADEQIPPIASELLVKRLCSLGQVVERRTYPGMGHAEVIVPSFADMFTWMKDRVAGKPAVSGCPT